VQLQRAELSGIGPFERAVFPFADDDGRPRRLTVIHGAGGLGKTTLLAAVASTRPGHAVAQTPRADGRAPPSESPPQAACDWLLGLDDPERPHPLRVASPNARLAGGEEEELLRRREQALFDRVAGEGGFAFLGIGSTRWFSKQPIVLSAPARSTARYDVRQAAVFDDASRSDLARETKQALAYAAIARALALEVDPERRLDCLGEAMSAVTGELSALAGFRYAGVDAHSFEPIFSGPGHALTFDALPTHARHLVAFAALSVRTLWAAYPDRDPRTAEGVVAIDDVDLHQDAALAARLLPALRRALPLVQWIVTTSSPIVAASVDAREVLALRRLPERGAVAVFSGQQALTH
jgi:hypothetical protein